MKAKMKIWTLLLSAGFMLAGCNDDPVSPGNPDNNDNGSSVEQPLADGSLVSIQLNDGIKATVGSEPWQFIAYGNGRYVAVGTSDSHTEHYSAYSTDGTNWLYKGQPSVFTWSGGLVYGNDIFASSGVTSAPYDRGVWYSSDGMGWESNQLSGDDVLSTIIYTDRFVGITNFGKICTSSDGIDWTQVQGDGIDIGNIAKTHGIAYGSGTYVVLGRGGRVCYSTDLQNWTSLQVGDDESSVPSAAVVFGNDKFVAIGNAAKVWISSDGINWTENDIDYAFSDITFAGGHFVASGNKVVGISSDGIDWEITPISINAECIFALSE